MFEEILSKIAVCFKKNNIPYMIIGGQAVLLYGEPRLTRDIDITLGVNIEHFAEILSLINELSLKPVVRDLEAFVRDTMVLPAIEESTGVRLDFIFSFTPYETEAIGRARKIPILGQEVFFASPEDLIIHKIFAGRAIDLEDVKSVMCKNKNVDVKHIRGKLKEFDEFSDKKGFLKTFDEILTSLAYK